jgi:hypothetical protein
MPTRPEGSPVKIAMLSYRSKPTCGGQGVYLRHLSRELVALGHHVEVFSGQPYPELDEGVILREVPWQKLLAVWEQETGYLRLGGQPVRAFLDHVAELGLRYMSEKMYDVTVAATRPLATSITDTVSSGFSRVPSLAT